MPFVRFSRDKKGYEHVYLVHTSQGQGRSSNARVLYWYRTPPGVKVGREPFDPEARRALEAQYPNIEFDWPRIVNTPKPPPETENWRERRRAERAIKQARAAEEREVPDEREGAQPESRRALSEPDTAGETEEPAEAVAAVAEPGSAPAEDGAPGDERRKRRRRGGRRRRKAQLAGSAAPASTSTGESGQPVQPEAAGPPEHPADSTERPAAAVILDAPLDDGGGTLEPREE